MQQRPSWEANSFSASQETPPPPFYGNLRFITKFTKVLYTYPYFELHKSNPCPHLTTWRSFLISSHLRLGLPSGLFSLDLTTKTLYAPRLSPEGGFIKSRNVSLIWSFNPLTPELNPSAQRCLPRFFTGILIFKGLTAGRLYKSFGVKGLIICQLYFLCNNICASLKTYTHFIN
jgi:hypothetical protein